MDGDALTLLQRSFDSVEIIAIDEKSMIGPFLMYQVRS